MTDNLLAKTVIPHREEEAIAAAASYPDWQEALPRVLDALWLAFFMRMCNAKDGAPSFDFPPLCFWDLKHYTSEQIKKVIVYLTHYGIAPFFSEFLVTASGRRIEQSWFAFQTFDASLCAQAHGLLTCDFDDIFEMSDLNPDESLERKDILYLHGTGLIALLEKINGDDGAQYHYGLLAASSYEVFDRAVTYLYDITIPDGDRLRIVNDLLRIAFQVIDHLSYPQGVLRIQYGEAF